MKQYIELYYNDTMLSNFYEIEGNLEYLEEAEKEFYEGVEFAGHANTFLFKTFNKYGIKLTLCTVIRTLEV